MRDDAPTVPLRNPILRYMATVSAARDFGVSRADIEDVVSRLDPLEVTQRDLADALADKLAERGFAA